MSITRWMAAAASALALAFAGATLAQKADAPKKAEPAKVAEAKKELIDINTASEQELATLKGIGEVRAKAIVKGRPYARKDELVQKKIIPQGVYKEIQESIIARQKK